MIYQDRRLLVKIRFPGAIESFASLARFTDALRFIDKEEMLLGNADREDRDRHLRNLNYRPPRSKLISFHVGSPPDLTFLANPAWIAILLAIVFNYHNIKNNVPAIYADIRNALKRMKGLSDSTREHVERLFIEFLTNASMRMRASLEHAGKELAHAESLLERRLERKRRELIGSSADEIEVEIIDLDEE